MLRKNGTEIGISVPHVVSEIVHFYSEMYLICRLPGTEHNFRYAEHNARDLGKILITSWHRITALSAFLRKRSAPVPWPSSWPFAGLSLVHPHLSCTGETRTGRATPGTTMHLGEEKCKANCTVLLCHQYSHARTLF